MGDKIRKIKIKPVGSKNRHEVTLFEMAERGVDMVEELAKASSSNPELIYAERRLNDYYNQAKTYLTDREYTDPNSNHWRYLNGEVTECDYPWEPLWAAIQDRDHQGGQTGEYLAALILCEYAQFQVAKHDYMWHGTKTAVGVMLDKTVHITELFFQWDKLENIQASYSAGKKCIDAVPKGSKKKISIKDKRYAVIHKFADKARAEATTPMDDSTLVNQVRSKFSQLIKKEPTTSQDLFSKNGSPATPSARTIRRALGLENNQK
jgi:hypothetical protein